VGEKEDRIHSLFDRYQLAGLDDRLRGFSRPVEFEQQHAQYRAIFRYESAHVVTEPSPTQDIALGHLIHLLHERGYRQLRTQMNFRNGTYLGSQEMWIEYPDPAPRRASGTLEKLFSWFRQRAVNE
jgi:hypothetical protein